MRTADFDFELPPELIAQIPAPRRDQSRLLVLHRNSQQIEHREFCDLLSFLRAGDVLVLNNSRVLPARLRGTNASTGGQFEVLLLEQNAINDWWVMMRPGKRARISTSIVFQDLEGKPTAIEAIVLEKNDEGHRRLQFTGTTDITKVLDALGEVPLPPYIYRARPNHQVVSPSPLRKGRALGRGVRSFDFGSTDRERYQTVFADPAGSVAAPTAGLHFTERLLDEIRSRRVQVCFLTLHVGLGTFAPVKSETLAAHTMHEERYELSKETARIINEAKQEGRRVIAVGTTTLRVLESVALRSRMTLGPSPDTRHPTPVTICSAFGKTGIFIYPPYDFKIADALLTNFHLPRSTLLMLVGAFAAPSDTKGRDLILSAYKNAIQERYRFFSYGDAMLLL